VVGVDLGKKSFYNEETLSEIELKKSIPDYDIQNFPKKAQKNYLINKIQDDPIFQNLRYYRQDLHQACR
jgi:hypothetical protein